MINLECLCSTADIAPEVNGFAEECWRAGTELRLDFPRGLSPEGHSVLLTQPPSHPRARQPLPPLTHAVPRLLYTPGTAKSKAGLKSQNSRGSGLEQP